MRSFPYVLGWNQWQSVLCSPNLHATHLKGFFIYYLVFPVLKESFTILGLLSLNNLYQNLVITIISFTCTEEQLFWKTTKRMQPRKTIPLALFRWTLHTRTQAEGYAPRLAFCSQSPGLPEASVPLPTDAREQASVATDIQTTQ